VCPERILSHRLRGAATRQEAHAGKRRHEHPASCRKRIGATKYWKSKLVAPIITPVCENVTVSISPDSSNAKLGSVPTMPIGEIIEVVVVAVVGVKKSPVSH
jgi:hypothetical protein